MQKKLLVISVCLLQPNFLPPANEVWGKVIFSEACVKNSVHRGGGGLVPGGGWVPGGDPPKQFQLRRVRILHECILVNTAVNDIHAKKLVSYSRVLVVTELVLTGIQCSS